MLHCLEEKKCLEFSFLWIIFQFLFEFKKTHKLPLHLYIYYCPSLLLVLMVYFYSVKPDMSVIWNEQPYLLKYLHQIGLLESL